MKNGSFRVDGLFRRSGGDPDVMATKSGGGCLVLFGLPFFLVGLLAVLTCIGLLPLQGDGGELSIMASGFFGIIFMIMGAALILGRSGWIIDRRQGRVVEWHGLIVPLKRTVHPLAQFEGVRLDCRREGKTADCSVQLTAAGDAAGLTVERTADYRQARRTAEELARFLKRPLEEISQGRRVVREPGHLDETLRERVRRLKEDQGFFPPQPIPMRTRIERKADGVILSIPGPPPGLGQVLPLTASLVLAGLATFVFLPGLLSLPAPAIIHYLFGGFIVIFAVLMPLLSSVLAVVRSARRKTRITATRALLSVEESTGGGTTRREIPADELEALEFVDKRSTVKGIEIPGMEKFKDLGDTGTPRFPDGRPIPGILLALMKMVPSQGIVARSDKTTLVFGRGLPEAELAYLHALILKALTD